MTMIDRPGTSEEHSRDPSGQLIEGKVTAALPHGLYRVAIAEGREVTAHVPSGPGRNFIRVLVGDRVRLELSTRDLARGRIVGVVK
jgi:translation initiation factor IF-1